MEHNTYLGRGWNFPPEFKQGAEITLMSSDEENIRQSLWILFSTTPGERVDQYDYGCPLRNYIFEILDVTTQTILTEQIKRCINLFEPRITIGSISFELKQNEGVMQVNLDYTICQTNKRSNMVYPFYLHEGTDINL